MDEIQPHTVPYCNGLHTPQDIPSRWTVLGFLLEERWMNADESAHEKPSVTPD